MPVLEGQFLILKLDTEGKKYKEVSRFEATDSKLQLHLIQDFHVGLYPMRVSDRFEITFWQEVRMEDIKQTNCEMILTGKCFKQEGSQEMELLISCGGLLTSLKGDSNLLQKFRLNEAVSITFRRITS